MTWTNGISVTDYNKLPVGNFRKNKIVTIDGSDSCIMEHGFEHLRGLSELEKMNLVNNKYLTDDSLEILAKYTKVKNITMVVNNTWSSVLQ